MAADGSRRAALAVYQRYVAADNPAYWLEMKLRLSVSHLDGC
jgi:hypothetical protein